MPFPRKQANGNWLELENDSQPVDLDFSPIADNDPGFDEADLRRAMDASHQSAGEWLENERQLEEAMQRSMAPSVDEPELKLAVDAHLQSLQVAQKETEEPLTQMLTSLSLGDGIESKLGITRSLFTKLVSAIAPVLLRNATAVIRTLRSTHKQSTSMQSEYAAAKKIVTDCWQCQTDNVYCAIYSVHIVLCCLYDSRVMFDGAPNTGLFEGIYGKYSSTQLSEDAGSRPGLTAAGYIADTIGAAFEEYGVLYQSIVRDAESTNAESTNAESTNAESTNAADAFFRERLRAASADLVVGGVTKTLRAVVIGSGGHFFPVIRIDDWWFSADSMGTVKVLAGGIRALHDLIERSVSRGIGCAFFIHQ